MQWRRLVWPHSGRLDRKGFFIGQGLLWLLPNIAAFVVVLLGGSWIASRGGSAQAFGAAFDHGQTIVGFVLLYWQTSLFTRRFHDIGWTGWLAVLPLAYPTISLINKVALSGADPTINPWRAGPFASIGSGLLWMIVVSAIFWTIAFLWPGQTHRNAHGAPPQGPWGDDAPDRARLVEAFV